MQDETLAAGVEEFGCDEHGLYVLARVEDVSLKKGQKLALKLDSVGVCVEITRMMFCDRVIDEVSPGYGVKIWLRLVEPFFRSTGPVTLVIESA